VKWPILLRPILATLAVGFAVSVAQYLPTLFAGGGRFVTVTTEAVALSAGGNRRVLAVQALLQIALPMAAFGLAAAAAYWLGRHRRGLR
jgi:putative thiamine transport system permease protein